MKHLCRRPFVRLTTENTCSVLRGDTQWCTTWLELNSAMLFKKLEVLACEESFASCRLNKAGDCQNPLLKPCMIQPAERKWDFHMPRHTIATWKDNQLLGKAILRISSYVAVRCGQKRSSSVWNKKIAHIGGRKDLAWDVKDYLISSEGISQQRCFCPGADHERKGNVEMLSVEDWQVVKQRPPPTEISCTSAERGSAATETCLL